MEMEDHVHSAQGIDGELPHAGLHEIGGLEQAGQIVEDELGVPFGQHADDR